MTVPNLSRPLRHGLFILVASFWILNACVPGPAVGIPAAKLASVTQPPVESTPTPRLDFTQSSSEPLSSASPTPESTSAGPLPTSTPNPDRLPPEQWREWPVVPAVTGRALDVYRTGLSKDLDRHALSKVGDCQSIREVLLGMYDHPDRLKLPADKAYLGETIQQFSGSFDRDGNGVKGGYNAAAVLSPLWADPNACQAGETPLACELRTHRPVFALISLEVWWDGRTPDRYEKYMRQIIEQMIANGTVPILSTKADNVEGDHSINLATARLAYEYDLPLWNWWRAAQDLPNGGLDPDRPDGFHLSIKSWLPRSETALETVDALWRGLESAVRDAQIVVVEPKPTLAPTRQAEIQSMRLEIQPAAVGTAAGELVFDLYTQGGASQGIFALSPGAEKTRRIVDPGWSLQDVSPDGNYFLANQGSRLSLLDRDGAEVSQLSAAFTAGLRSTALFTPDGSSIVWTGADGSLRVLPLDGSPLRTLPFPDSGPIELNPAQKNSAVFALAGRCTAPGACDPGARWILPLDATQPTRLEAVPFGSSFAAASETDRWAFGLPGAEDKTGVELHAPNGSPRQLPFSGESILDLAWDPAGKSLSVFIAQRSDYSGKNFGSRHAIVTSENFGIRKLADLKGQNPHQAWSPDGSRLARAATRQDSNGYRLALDMFDLATGKLSQLAQGDPALASDQFLYTSRIAWLP